MVRSGDVMRDRVVYFHSQFPPFRQLNLNHIQLWLKLSFNLVNSRALYSSYLTPVYNLYTDSHNSTFCTTLITDNLGMVSASVIFKR